MMRNRFLAGVLWVGLALLGWWAFGGGDARAREPGEEVPGDVPPDAATGEATLAPVRAVYAGALRGAIEAIVTAGSASADPDAPTGRLAVLDADDEAPIAGARVWEAEGLVGTTDGAGLVRVPLGDGGVVTLRVEAEGYAHFDGRVTFPFWAPERSGKVELRPAVTLHGRVLDALTRAVVPAARMWQEFGFCDCSPAEIEVDDQGRFEVPGLPRDGQVTLGIEAEGYPRTWREIWLEESDAEVRQDVLLTRGRFVVGRVEDWETAAPLPGARVEALVTDEDGVFRGWLGLDPGTELASVTVEADGHAGV